MMKYEKIANVIRQKIHNRDYQPGTLIPNQKMLADEFNVSRMTVKKAMDILELEGLIYRKRGSGTFVKKTVLSNKVTADIMDYEGLTKQLSDKKVESQIILFKLDFPSEKIQEKLLIGSHEPIYKIIRLRVVDSKPFIIEHTIMPTNLIPGINEDILKRSVYQYIKNELKLKINSTYRKIHADKPSKYDRKYLNCGVNDPVLEVEQVVYLEDGTPFEYSRSRNKYSARSYSVVDIN